MASSLPPSPDGKILKTTRLTLHMVDPANPHDCDLLVDLYAKYFAAHGVRGSMTTLKDIRRKHELMGARAEFCTLAPPPVGIIHLIYLNDNDQQDDGSNEPGTLAGHIVLSTRREMPCPDLGYALLKDFEGKGYAFEAARTVLDFWRKIIGVREIFVGTKDDNVRSQKLAERLGFVKAGGFTVATGRPPNETRESATAFVLPGMEWREGYVLRPDLGTGS